MAGPGDHFINPSEKLLTATVWEFHVGPVRIHLDAERGKNGRPCGSRVVVRDDAGVTGLDPGPMGVTITYKRKVRKGDTLSRLAEEIYGDPEKWPLIWMRNRGRALSSNYNVLPVGAWIEIPLPASITPAQLEESRRIAAGWRPGLAWR